MEDMVIGPEGKYFTAAPFQPAALSGDIKICVDSDERLTLFTNGRRRHRMQQYLQIYTPFTSQLLVAPVLPQ